MERAALFGTDLVLGYDRTEVVREVSVGILPGRVTVLIGPNGSGKSTVLRALARLHPVTRGGVEVGDADGQLDPLGSLSAREIARRITLLSQAQPRPSGLTVRDVVGFGRHPHRRRFAALADDDRQAIDGAMAMTGIAPMADRPVDQLSGGELQRVWLATCLAQDTGVVLLDEPTNHLDLRFQVEILDLARDLADDHGRAVGMVLHDLNQAATVADDVVLLHDGRVHAVGPPEHVLTAAHLSEVYGLDIDVTRDATSGVLRVEPARRHDRRARREPTTTPRETAQ